MGAIDSPPKTPCILGFECAGEIEAIGEEVEDFKVGDRIVALPEFRAWAELVAVPAKYVYKIPDEMSFTDAAAIAMNYLVAYILLFDLASIKSGKSILLHSAGGGVVSIIYISFFIKYKETLKLRDFSHLFQVLLIMDRITFFIIFILGCFNLERLFF